MYVYQTQTFFAFYTTLLISFRKRLCRRHSFLPRTYYTEKDPVPAISYPKNDLYTVVRIVVFRSETSLCMRSFTRKSVHFCAILICGRAMDEKRKKNTQKVSFLNHWFSSELRSVVSLSYWSLINYAFLPLLLQYIELCFALLFVLKVWKGTREDVEVPKERRKVFMATRKTWMSGPYVLSRLRWVIKKGDGDSLSFFNDYVQPLVPVHT